MPISNFPGGFSHGVNIRGLPILNTYPGKTFWVHSGTGSDGNKGTFDRPFATIDKCFDTGKVSANRGDIIMVKAGHAETIATDGGLTCDVAGVSIIGLGTGTSRPTLTVNGLSAAVVAVSAANISLSNFLFLGNLATLVACLEIAGDYCEVGNCEFRELGASGGMITAITIGVAVGDSDYAHIHDCTFRMDEPGVTNVGDAAIEIIEDHDNIVIENNWIYGDFDDAGIHVPTAGNACDFLVIRNNYVENTAANSHAIEITTGGTMNGGALVDNRLISDNALTLLQPHTLQCLGNLGHLSAAASVNSADFPVPGYLAGPRGVRTAKSSRTFTAAAYEINTAVAVFTVAGEVMARCFGHVTTAIESDAGNNGTLSVGIEDNVALLLPVVVADETNFTAQDVWAEATTTLQGDKLYNEGEFVLIAGGEDIELDILVEDFTSGVLELTCEWYPVSVDGSVVGAS